LNEGGWSWRGASLELVWSWSWFELAWSWFGAGLGLVWSSRGLVEAQRRKHLCGRRWLASVLALLRIWVEISLDFAASPCTSLALLRIWVEISLDLAASPCTSLALLRIWVEISLDLAASLWRRWLAAPCLDSDHSHPTQRRSRRERLRDRGGRWIDTGR